MEPSNLRRTFIADENTLHDVLDQLEILSNLTYIICAEANKPTVVVSCANQCEDRIRKAGGLIHGIMSR